MPNALEFLWNFSGDCAKHDWPLNIQWPLLINNKYTLLRSVTIFTTYNIDIYIIAIALRSKRILFFAIVHYLIYRKPSRDIELNLSQRMRLRPLLPFEVNARAHSTSPNGTHMLAEAFMCTCSEIRYIIQPTNSLYSSNAHTNIISQVLNRPINDLDSDRQRTCTDRFQCCTSRYYLSSLRELSGRPPDKKYTNACTT